MTLEGPYQNLRRFISDVERGGNDFVIISAIELEPSDSQAQKSPDTGATTEQNYGGVINPTTGQPLRNPQNYGMTGPSNSRLMNQQYSGIPMNPNQRMQPYQQQPYQQ